MKQMNPHVKRVLPCTSSSILVDRGEGQRNVRMPES